MRHKYVIFTIVALLILAVMSFTNSSNSKFYYAYNEKIYLNELDNKLIVRYMHNKKSNKELISLSAEIADKQLEWKDDSTCVITITPQEKEYFKNKILKQPDVKSCNPIYSINTGLEMGVTDEFVVRFHENASPKEIDKLHKNYDIEVVKITDIYHLLKVPVGADALEIANKYQESGLTRFSHPGFVSEIEFHQAIPNDPYFFNQFSLHNIGQVFTDGHSGTFDADIDAPEAWSITKGNNNIIIAVLDQGVTPDHPDLPNARQVRLMGSNFADGDPNNPSPRRDENHGNACAGIIAATQNNHEGIAGIAPNCRIMPLYIHGASVPRVADAITFAWQNGAHIISISWSYRQDGTNPNLFPLIRDAIIAATTQGRDGLGCVVVCSASNSAHHAQGINGDVRFPSNVNVAGVLTVGASDRYDLQANYSPTSNPGSPNNQIIDIVAPSHRAYSNQIAGETKECWTIDIPGYAGYNPVWETDGGSLPLIGSIMPESGINHLSYTARFGGTSYSCPQVSGVAALMLSVNPNLTQQQVFDIITATADKVGGYAYTNGRSNELGFGRLNAYRAVMQSLAINGSPIICNSNSTYSINMSNSNFDWSHSPNIIYVGGQGTNSYTVRAASSTTSGEGWIQASFIGQSGLTSLRKDVWVGVPSTLSPPNTVNIHGAPCVERNNFYIYNLVSSTTQQPINTIPGASTYTWSLTPNDPNLTISTINNGQINCGINISSNAILGNNYTLQLNAVNSCGNVLVASKNIKVYNEFIICEDGGSMPKKLAISPNPATLQVNITEINPTNENIPWVIRIMSQTGVALITVSTQLPKTINVSNFNRGVYYLHARKGNYYEQQVFVIE